MAIWRSCTLDARKWRSFPPSVLRNFNSTHLRVNSVLYCASLCAGFSVPFICVWILCSIVPPCVLVFPCPLLLILRRFLGGAPSADSEHRQRPSWKAQDESKQAVQHCTAASTSKLNQWSCDLCAHVCLAFVCLCRCLDSGACVGNPSFDSDRSSTIELRPQGVRWYASPVFSFSVDFVRFVLGFSHAPNHIPVVCSF